MDVSDELVLPWEAARVHRAVLSWRGEDRAMRKGWWGKGTPEELRLLHWISSGLSDHLPNQAAWVGDRFYLGR